MSATTMLPLAVLHEAYPQHILFVEDDDQTYWLRGGDLFRVKAMLRLACGGDSAGFDRATATLYIRELLARYVKVGIVRGNAVQTLGESPPPQPQPQAIASTPVGISPELLLGQKELARLTRSLTRQQSLLREFIEGVRRDLTGGNERILSDFGTLYVYQVGLDCFEMDWELTRIPEAVVAALCVAAHLAGRMLRCELVQPKARRRKKAAAPKPTIIVSQPVTYGQLRLSL